MERYTLTPEGNKFLEEKGLSDREIEVITAQFNNETAKGAAAELFVTEKTIKFHNTHIYKKLKVKNKKTMILALIRFYGTKPFEAAPKVPEKIDFKVTLGNTALPRGSN